MKRVALVFIVGAAIGIAGLTLAQAKEKASKHGEQVKVLASYDVKEKLDGKDATVTMVEVTFEPRGAGTSHRHPGPAFVYVVEGTYELGIDDKPTKIYKAGQTFQEPSGCLHRVSRNPSSKGNTKLIAIVLHPRSAKEILTPADH
jgi:quercetin dioxygenase-like cupin family protein